MSPKILIVDDGPFNVELLEYILRAEGFRTCSAGSGSEAVQKSREERPDLILLDVMMPGENGFETCARLKSDPSTADIPVIFVSALNDVTSKVTGLRSGGVDYLSKPVDGEEVLARVRVHLRIRENNRALAREYKTRIEEFRSAQQAILLRPEDCPEACFAVCYRPVEEAGGDFYDVLTLDPGVFGYFVADVSGHGVSAAFLTSAIKALLRQYSGALFSPEDTLRGVDAVMRQMLGEEQYLTACYARLNRNTGRLSVVSAGHPPMIVVDTEGNARTIDMYSEPLGLFSALVLQRQDISVCPGDRFFLYTDGVIESSPGGSRQEGLARLIDACVRHRRDTPKEAVMNIAGENRTGQAGNPSDDLLLLAVEVEGMKTQ
ncbi:MAG TPA: response regulator [Bryobacteraceae bacterium]|nr:response regulator [Bryobacteraceae bacterium]